MGPVRLLARPMLASVFVTGGVAALSDPEGHAAMARDVTKPVSDALDDVDQVPDASETQLVQLHGAAQVLGGLLLAFGKLPRLAALLLAGSLIPTTIASHRFWEAAGAERQAQQIHFFKNLSLLGGLLIATFDREGEPSLIWRGKHAKQRAERAVEHATEVARLRTELAKSKAKAATSVGAVDHLRVRTELAKEQLTPDVMDAKRLISAIRSDD